MVGRARSAVANAATVTGASRHQPNEVCHARRLSCRPASAARVSSLVADQRWPRRRRARHVAKESWHERAPGRSKRSCRRSSLTIAIRASSAAKPQTSWHRDVAEEFVRLLLQFRWKAFDRAGSRDGAQWRYYGARRPAIPGLLTTRTTRARGESVLTPCSRTAIWRRVPA